MKRILIAFPLVFLSFEATSAEPSSSPLALNLNSDSLSFDVGLGWLKGESKEYVYDPNSKYKISQLNWNIGNALIAKGNISWDAFYRLTLNTRGWIKLTSRNSSMDDYDWEFKQSHWSDWSSSPDSPLNYANEFDLNATGWLIKQFNYKLGAILGYQETRFSWTAYGGHYIYNNGMNVGDFPSGTQGIGYQQKYRFPYIGLIGQYRYQDLEFNVLLKFSQWVKAKDHDEHYMRNLTFYEESNNVRYYSISIDAGYYVTPKVKVYTAFVWNKYREGKGDMMKIDNDSRTNYYSGGDSAGIANRNYSIDLGVQYRF
ncbi:omptin family outer membrane protease [Xenorhabdus sp. PB62.4]|uniref:omptin family outer membrane protease n=1 Tax=Xenorhabdus sp. PB62.4 TaxID=1851573 RepID=UPI001656A67D|nr:omptin family outer membrane protease [Xenorhabdus sp. PB62.4]MBC8953228.1 plasminogen activator protease precursor [Xenorhabdus sp. PB62.4]